MMDSMVERVARGIAKVMAAKSFDPTDIEPNDDDYECARAAIEAMLEPTDAMIKAGEAVHSCVHTDHAAIFIAMIAAAMEDHPNDER